MKQSGNVIINVLTQLTGKILFFVGLSLTLIAAFAWNDAIKNLVQKYINFSEKFIERRGRINCSLKDEDGWRFSGFQFVQN